MNKVYQVFQKWVQTVYKRNLYDYQREIAEKILKAFLYDRKRGPAPEIAIEVSRQAGKTTTVVDVVAFLMLWYGPVAIGIFAPQREQAKTDFDRLKVLLDKFSRSTGLFNPDEKNANTLRIDNGSECYIFPVTKTSHPESKTLDLIISEESQSIDDHEFLNDVRPMGASTNAPIVNVGTAGYKICHFYRLTQGKNALIYNYERVIADKRKMYEQTGDDNHLNYEKFVLAEKERLGEESDEFQAPYMLKWILGAGQFVSMEGLEAMVAGYGRCYQDRTSKCYAGIDTAKNPDSTVVTILRWNEELKTKQLINWLELRGDNYKDQFDIIMDFLSHYNIQALAIDSTGQGDFMPDMFARESNFMDENSGLYRVKFSPLSKDVMYKNLTVVVQKMLTQLPKLETKEGDKFKSQLLDLQKEFNGELLRVHHPDSPDAHDDYPDSWALAEYAYSKTQEGGDLNIRII